MLMDDAMRTEPRPRLKCRQWLVQLGSALTRFGLHLLFSSAEGSAGMRHPLEPLDTTSPRATFESFWALTEKPAHFRIP